MDACTSGKALANSNELFRLSLNDELSSRYLAAHEKTLCSIRIDALQALQIVCGIQYRNKQRAVPCLPHAFQSCKYPCSADKDGWDRTLVPNSTPIWPVGLLLYGVWCIPLRIAAVWIVEVPAMRTFPLLKASAFLRHRTCSGHQFPSCTTREWPVCPDGQCTRHSVCGACLLWGNGEECHPRGLFQGQDHVGQARHGKYGENHS